MRALFATPGFGRLFAGLVVSAFGDWCMLLVLSIWVKQLTGSSSLAGLAIFFLVLPSLVAPLLGLWVDRVPRRPLLVWGNVVSALLVLPLLLVRTREDVWVIFAVALLYGTSLSILGAGVAGFVKELVAEQRLAEANSALQTSREALRLFAPLLGAWLFATAGGRPVTLLDAASFLVAAAVIATVPSEQLRPAPSGERLRDEMVAGVRHLVRDRVLRHTTVGLAILLLALGLSEATIYAVLDAFGRPVTWVAVIVTCQGVGAVVGAVTASRAIHRLGEVGTLAAAMTLLCVGLLALTLAPSFGVVLAAASVVGVSIPPLVVSVNTLVQRRSPQAVLGRASLALEVLVGGPQALSIAVGALLVAVVGFRWIYGAMALVTALATAYVVASLRDELHRPEPPGEASAAAGEEAAALLEGEHAAGARVEEPLEGRVG